MGPWLRSGPAGGRPRARWALGFDVSLPSLVLRPRDCVETAAIFARPACAAQSASAPSAS